MFTVTIATTPGQPGRVFGRIGLQGRGLTRDCLLAFRGRFGLFGVVRLGRYEIGVEPLMGLLARLLLRIPDGDEAQARSPVSYVSVSVYRGPVASQEALREHLVATSNGVLLEVEYADEDRERRTAGAAHRYRSSVMMTGHAVCTLLWSGGKPAPLKPLPSVLVCEGGVACSLVADISPYTRRRFLRRLGGGGREVPDVFFASDWTDFLSGVLAEAEGAGVGCGPGH